MRRRLFESNRTAWQKKQTVKPNKANKVVYIITALRNRELGVYEDFWDAVMDAEDKYCVDANMIDAYYEITDEDGLNSYVDVEENAPYNGRWTEEEGVLIEPKQTYAEFLEMTALAESAFDAFSAPGVTSWVARTPTAPTSASQVPIQSATAATTAATSKVPSSSINTATPKNQNNSKSSYNKTPITRAELQALSKAAAAEDNVWYSLLIAKIYMDRLADVLGLDLNDKAYAGFYDVTHGGLADLCQDVEDEEAWPSINDAEALFKAMVGRQMTPVEVKHMSQVLKMLDSFIAPYGCCEVFLNTSDFYDLRASRWLDSECDYDDYDIAFSLGWNGKPEEDWYAMMGNQYNHAAEYLECSYAYGAESRTVINMICTI